MSGKVALVTGASQGIGRASALRFAASGARVVVADLNEDGGEETAALIRQAGGTAAFCRTDVTAEQDVERVIAFTLTKFGQLDYAHNNAGGRGGEALTLHDLSEEDWDALVDLNLKAAWLCMKHELVHMLARGRGAIVNTGSTASYRGSLSAGWYTAAKHGLVGLTRWAAHRYAAQGIRINAVCPGVTETQLVVGRYGPEGAAELGARLNPIGRLIQPSEIAEAAVWLCSDLASAITGVILPVDGGMSTI